MLFNTKGFSATSMQDILRATSLQKGGVYGHFSSKEEIALAAFDYAFNNIMERISTRVRAHRNANDRLTAIVEFYRNYSINPTIPGGCPIQNTAVDADDTIPTLKDRAKKAVEYMLDSMAQIIKKGQERGEITDKLIPKNEALIIFSQIQGALMMAKVTNNPTALNTVLDLLETYIKTQFPAKSR